MISSTGTVKLGRRLLQRVHGTYFFRNWELVEGDSTVGVGCPAGSGPVGEAWNSGGKVFVEADQHEEELNKQAYTSSHQAHCFWSA